MGRTGIVQDLIFTRAGQPEGGFFFDCTNTTSRILDVLEQERPKIILLDELDKFSKSWQNKLLSLLEEGRIKVDQIYKQYDFTIREAKVFVTANDLNKLSAPLRSRFRRLHLPKYTKEIGNIIIYQDANRVIQEILLQFIRKLLRKLP